MNNCEDTTSGDTVANNMDVTMEDVEESTEAATTVTKTLGKQSENTNLVTANEPPAS